MEVFASIALRDKYHNVNYGSVMPTYEFESLWKKVVLVSIIYVTPIDSAQTV